MSLSRALLFSLLALAAPAAAFAASTNVEKVILNDDASVTLVAPFGVDPQGVSLWFHESSDLDAICKVFGQENGAVTDSLITDGEYDQTMVLNARGVFDSHVNRSASQTRNQRVKVLACRSLAYPEPSEHYSKELINDDRTITIIDPWFASPDGESRWISTQTDLTGVCKLFGHRGYVANSMTRADEDLDRTILLDAKGKLSGIKDKNDQFYNYRVKTVMCVPIAPLSPQIPVNHQGITGNGDGTVVIKGPWFASADGESRWYSSLSDAGGVCRIYGYTSFVTGTLELGGVEAKTVALGMDAKFSSFSENVARIAAIGCR